MLSSLFCVTVSAVVCENEFEVCVVPFKTRVSNNLYSEVIVNSINNDQKRVNMHEINAIQTLKRTKGKCYCKKKETKLGKKGKTMKTTNKFQTAEMISKTMVEVKLANI